MWAGAGAGPMVSNKKNPHPPNCEEVSIINAVVSLTTPQFSILFHLQVVFVKQKLRTAIMLFNHYGN